MSPAKKANSTHLYAVLLAGGGGTRLWPKSQGDTPKQFLKLAGKQTMMQIAAERVSRVVDWSRIIVVTNHKYLKQVQKQLPQVSPDNIIAEPEKKDTAIAMLVGALYAANKDPKAVIINGASDHIVEDMPEFIRVMNAAAAIAADDKYLVTVGIIPQYPTSAFGYIKVGNDLRRINHSLALFKVDSFTEKPNLATATAFISTGKYFWNANMYVWSARAISKAFQELMPEMWQLCQTLLKAESQKFRQNLPAIYKQAQAISIDYAISEKADNLVLIPGNFGWNDVGDWQVVYNLGKKDLFGNVVISQEEQAKEEQQAILINAQDNLLHTNGRTVVLLGVKDLIVVDTDKALLICPKNRSQEVKKVVDRLKEEKRQDLL